ncbi:YppG family protein [Alkalihalobacterium elongatum]|uniref:YppG family protein n=1 Tax=Alkalihalobacterium elongatum TaxID=2675466 RepID=UPI001C1F6078|nr:YppG family protein [Alkalihalobacterium elongatum]
MNFYNESPFRMQGYPYFQQQSNVYPSPYQNTNPNPFHGGFYSPEMYQFPNQNYNIPTQYNWQQGIPGNQRPNNFGPQYPYQGPALLNAFKGEDGKFDISKTFQTVDQLVKTVNQISPLVKSMSSMFTPKA